MTVRYSRRQLFGSLAAATAGVSASGWFPAFADALNEDPQRRRHCILLWMSGGPSQTDTFDLKPDHENGGEFKEIQTNSPGLRISEHLPELAKMGDKLAVIRSLSTREGDHGRGTFLMRTGHPPMGPIRYPSIGASLSKQLGDDNTAAGLPGYVSVGPFRAFAQDAFGSGFLGPRFGPLIVGASDMPGSQPQQPRGNNGQPPPFPALKVEAMERAAGITEARFSKRLEIWDRLQSNFLATRAEGAPKTHHTVYQGAVQLMGSEDANAFKLDDEPEALREAYGRNVFGQGCLLARRLVERGVPFIEVSLGGGAGWDTHADNFTRVANLSRDLDAGWATLMKDLDERGLLESTTILWMGEFGRTPSINSNAGRDHFPAAWSCVLAGGGIAGGQAYGKTSKDGNEVVADKVEVGDVLATLCEALGVSSGTMQQSNIGRPLPITEGFPIRAILS
jgi:hypothetical protein